jgi:endonuclease/exonuclease/phosphatase (EEP) superfamily protein YafD
VLCYVLSVLATVGFLASLGAALTQWDFSPWWIWPGSIAAIVILQLLAAILMERGR